jgi:N-methylhydantoinase A/oxoprolinase/acetone carboxylase beta subunit
VEIGIDVGGTFTDAVLLEDGYVRAVAKVPTGEDPLESVLAALDTVLPEVPSERVGRVVLSTTLITNLIAHRKYDPVALVLIPGPGLPFDRYRINPATYIVSGAVDYRGREIEPLNEDEVRAVARDIAARGYRQVAVVGKFSPRNAAHELRAAAILKEAAPELHVELGHLVAGQLNFPRRILTAFLTCATRQRYAVFARAVAEGLRRRGLTARAFVLKADGGTLPLEAAARYPVETVFSGPAASTLGVQALLPPGETAVVLDAGGTTTDLALILSGTPLVASRGLKVDDQFTQVRGLAVKSVPVGGDSVLERIGRELIVYSDRVDRPYCLGGSRPTPTDALRVLGHTEIGDPGRAYEAMALLATGSQSPQAAAEEVLVMVTDIIAGEIEAMFREWQEEPAYRVWEVLQRRTRKRPDLLVGVGGAAGLAPLVAQRLGARALVPPYAAVANAIGAAVARTTLTVSLHVDTARGRYVVAEEGYQGELEDPGHFGEHSAVQLATAWLRRRAAALGVADEVDGVEILRQDVFNIVRDWHTVGRLFDLVVQTPRGILTHVKGVRT